MKYWELVTFFCCNCNGNLLLFGKRTRNCKSLLYFCNVQWGERRYDETLCLPNTELWNFTFLKKKKGVEPT